MKEVWYVPAFRQAKQMRNAAVRNEKSHFHTKYFPEWLK